ncbi:ribosomal protein S18-alanine N-acetyltransferase [Frigoribacterium faeni]|uniref:Ribosomal-protein-alanine acetyltransferase n=1 Tax=Frigoribacterium faeni TaxID=145483 RepID=A0A7W3PJG8_9MICO|nr:ribosomal protein S18-alanine N-acetyltransferase [Frigoribacterium faeni]MBA8814033.1 ribosomal-protein-alanine acetyltransferase [Frigoribacterium faeni]MBA8814887.1 ribosomal-protein-alanine acetyltransferase [Frigoribacterium faeni]BFF15385.1 ribosomal protein S18-alanine N-acetyltransferase [Microbacterium flavescens]GEK82588.1 ribosomal-protein-alanine acetyltransferase [Frigoribacterium faeni]
MSFRLRRATPDDLDGIMALETSVFVSDAWSREGMAHELASPDGWYLVATPEAEPDDSADDTAVVGYAGLLALPGAPDADVQTIAVAPGARRHGLGRTLMTRLLDEARRRRVREVFLEVRADNPSAQRLYASLGFEQIAVRPRYYMPDAVDAFVMRLVVPPTATSLASPGASSPAPQTGPSS